MLIPYGMQYLSTVEGVVWKVVRCEQCQTAYAYRMAVSATGAASSFLFLDNEGARDRASAAAAEALNAGTARRPMAKATRAGRAIANGHAPADRPARPVAPPLPAVADGAARPAEASPAARPSCGPP
jgi:hypothetical protein